MFTGIIQYIGTIEAINRRDDLFRLGIGMSFSNEIKIGDSISVNGVCLTVVNIEKNIVYFDVARQSLQTTNMGSLKLKENVNIEQALKAGDKLGGHFVTGHVDTVGLIKQKSVLRDQAFFEIAINNKAMAGVVDKGSVAIDGISLTVAEVKKNSFVVNVIPHTLKVTTLGFKKTGDTVNIELDIMGKYANKDINNVGANTVRPLPPASNKITEDFLKEHGF